jgi:hypothetical protein
MAIFDVKTDPPTAAVAPADKFPFGSVALNGFDTITAANLLKAICQVTNDAAGVRAALGISGGSATNAIVFASSNADSVTLPAGSPVAAQPPGIARAKASDSTRSAVGLLASASLSGNPATVQTDGTLTLADWTAVLGTASLAPRQLYFVDPLNAGKLTAAVPTSAGQQIQSVGTGLTTDTMLISIRRPFLI